MIIIIISKNILPVKRAIKSNIFILYCIGYKIIYTFHGELATEICFHLRYFKVSVAYYYNTLTIFAYDGLSDTKHRSIKE